MITGRPKVLVVGGSGTFGAHVCRRLARLNRFWIVIGGRNAENARLLLPELLALDPGCKAEFLKVDRTNPRSAGSALDGLFAIIDAAGPFQGSSFALAETAIALHAHYIDLCDARDFASAIRRLDPFASQAGVALLTGASSTPGISNAMVRELVQDWRSIDRITVSILPGNRAPRGRSVMEAILGWVGSPVTVFDNGRWQDQPGWSGTSKVSLGKMGKRRASLAETPDLDVLVDDFRPRVSARFQAGLELGIMHQGLRLAGWLRRFGMLPRLSDLAGFFQMLARPLERLGTDGGGMVVEAQGIDADGTAVRATARLLARNGHGPIIPALASVALLKRLSDGNLLFCGCDHAGHYLNTAEIMELIPDLDITLEREIVLRSKPLFRTVLGDAQFDIMPSATREIHRGAPAVLAAGFADIEPPDNVFGRIVSALFRFPAPGRQVPVYVLIEQTDKGERWVRRYPERVMLSVMGHARAEENTLEETFGLLSFRMRIVATKDGLDMHMISARAGWIALPKFLTPKISATERVDSLERHVFDVSIRLPIIGKIVRYTGWLERESGG